jgi:hypothetical protein
MPKIFDYDNMNSILYSFYDKALANQDKYIYDANYPKNIAATNSDIASFIAENSAEFNKLFSSKTQSMKEALLGCALMHYTDQSVNIRQPYLKLGENAFSGRTLDQKVINPFLTKEDFSCTNGPYLAVFRRKINFTPELENIFKDKEAYKTMLGFISKLEQYKSKEEIETFIIALLVEFIKARNESKIPVFKLRANSIDQFRTYLTNFLEIKSGGLIPVLITVAFFQTVNEVFTFNWEITWRGINVADKAKGDEGDITIKENNKTILAVEITERPIDANRIISTINTKVMKNELKTYLFIYTTKKPDEKAQKTANSYFSTGIEINFANIMDLIINFFIIFDNNVRKVFSEKLFLLIDSNDTPVNIKKAWNDNIKDMVHKINN